MEAPAVVYLGPRMTPETIWHAMLSLKWDVLRVLEDWTTPVYWEVLGRLATPAVPCPRHRAATWRTG